MGPELQPLQASIWDELGARLLTGTHPEDSWGTEGVHPSISTTEHKGQEMRRRYSDMDRGCHQRGCARSLLTASSPKGGLGRTGGGQEGLDSDGLRVSSLLWRVLAVSPRASSRTSLSHRFLQCQWEWQQPHLTWMLAPNLRRQRCSWNTRRKGVGTQEVESAMARALTRNESAVSFELAF